MCVHVRSLVPWHVMADLLDISDNFMSQISKEISYTNLRHEFIKTKSLHCYNTRQSSILGFSLQAISTKFEKSFLTFEGIKL